MKTVPRGFAVCLFVLACVLSAPGAAQVLSVAGTSAQVLLPVAAGVAVKDLIAEARQQATTLIADGRNSGDALMTRAGDELNMMADNVARLAASKMDDAVSDLDRSLSKIVVSLHAATVSAKQIGKQAYDIKDTAALDLRSILGDIPFVNERLLVQRMGGLTQLVNTSDYQMDLIASYVGTPSEEHTTALEITLDGAPLEGIKLNPVGLHQTTLRIPNASLQRYFSPERIAFVDARLVIKQKFRKGFWPFKIWHEKSYAVPFNLILYPSYAGTLEVVAREKVYGWKAVEPKSNSATGGNNHCARKCKDHRGSAYEVGVTVSGGVRSPQLPGDQRIERISSCVCVSGTCGYDERNHALVDLSDTRARCGWQGRSHPSTWRIVADVVQWTVLSERESSSSVKVYWDQNLEVRIPKQSTLVTIRGTLLSGKNIDLIDGQPEADNAISKISTVENLTDVSLIYRINRPEGI